MPMMLCAMSHSPLRGRVDPNAAVLAEVAVAVDTARALVEAFDPEVAVVIGPDHYNGVFYRMLPPFCIGTAAEAIGDFGGEQGTVAVDAALAAAVIEAVLDADVDVAVSERLLVDHGITQPLEILFGGIDAVPVIPVFVNGVAPPFSPVRRVRALGQAIGATLAATERRVLVIASGGLSHDPPVPQLATAASETREQLIVGRELTPTQRAAREDRVIQAAIAFAAGTSDRVPLNPVWDREVMATLAAGDFDAVDRWTAAWMGDHGGGSAHEVRTWVAGFAALAAAGHYEVTQTYYRPIPEWIAGYGIAVAHTRAAAKEQR